MFRDEGEDRKPHGCGQHVEDPCHVIHIQLAGHHLILFIVADPSQPLGLQLLHFTYWRWGGGEKTQSEGLRWKQVGVRNVDKEIERRAAKKRRSGKVEEGI